MDSIQFGDPLERKKLFIFFYLASTHLALLLPEPRHPFLRLSFFRGSRGRCLRPGRRLGRLTRRTGHVTIRRRSGRGGCVGASAQVRGHVSAGSACGLGLFLGLFGGRCWCTSSTAGFLSGLTLSPAGGAASARCEVETRGGALTLSIGARWSCGWLSGLPAGTAGFGFFLTLPLSGGGFVESPVYFVSDVADDGKEKHI